MQQETRPPNNYFTSGQVIRDLRTLMSGIKRNNSDLDEYLFLSIRNILLWIPEKQ